MDDDCEAPIDLAQASEVTGESDPDHNTVSLTVRRRNGRRATLCIPGADLQRLVPLLVPTDSLHVGPLPSGETLLAVGIGPATVGLSLPGTAAEKLGRSLLAASATVKETSH